MVRFNDASVSDVLGSMSNSQCADGCVKSVAVKVDS